MIERWIVVGGCPRSGTTVVGNALGAAENAIVTPEAQFASEALAAVRAGTLDPTPEAIVAFITSHWRFQIWNEPAPTTWPDFSGCRSGASICSLVIGHLVSEYARRHGKENARVWIDHTPRHLRAIPDLETSDFELSAVHLIRDGRGVAASMKNVDWGPRDVASLAHWWNARIAEGFAAERALGGRATNMRYDDLVMNPEAALKQLCRDLNIDYSERMLTSQALRVVDYTKSQHKLVGSSLDPSRVAAWESSLSKREQEIFESISGDALRLLGYKRLFPNARSPSFLERLHTAIMYNPVRLRLLRHRRRRRRSAMSRVP
jgi:hypothetical protein